MPTQKMIKVYDIGNDKYAVIHSQLYKLINIEATGFPDAGIWVRVKSSYDTYIEPVYTNLKPVIINEDKDE